MIAAEPRIRDLAITTNGILLGQEAQALRDAGIHRVTVSLDTLKPDRFQALTRRDAFAQVLEGIEAVRSLGWPGLKLDTVVMRGVNDDEIADLIEFARRVCRRDPLHRVHGRGRRDALVHGHRWSPAPRCSSGWGRATGGSRPSWSSRRRPPTASGCRTGSPSGSSPRPRRPFCSSCDRSRLTADGQWLLCLYATTGIDLRKHLREGASKDDLVSLIRSTWGGRRDRGAEERLLLKDRQPLIQIGELKAKPHLEMHTRGG